MDSPTPVRISLQGGSSGELPLTPRKYSRNVLQDLPHTELVEKVIELESALCEFQESSKELELALEEELLELELANIDIKNDLKTVQRQLEESRTNVAVLSQEVNLLQDSNNSKAREHENEMHALKQQVVSIEIANDSMESHDRLIRNKLDLTIQFNNELLERLALMENDLERERRISLEKELYITNYQNEVKDLTRKLEEEVGDILVINMREVLNAGPPASLKFSQIPKSNSLKKLQDMTKEVLSFIRKSTVGKGGLTIAEGKIKSSAVKSLPTTLTTEATISKEDTISVNSAYSPRSNSRSIRSSKSTRSSLSLSGSPATLSSMNQHLLNKENSHLLMNSNTNLLKIANSHLLKPANSHLHSKTSTHLLIYSDALPLPHSIPKLLGNHQAGLAILTSISPTFALIVPAPRTGKRSTSPAISEGKTEYREPRRRELLSIKGSPNGEKIIVLEDRPRSKLKIFGRA